MKRLVAAHRGALLRRACCILALTVVLPVFSQSHDLKTEKEKIAKIEAAIKTEDNPTYFNECEQLLDSHRINALAWYLCGKHLLSVKAADAQTARANASLAYRRLKVAVEVFSKTSRQVFYALDAEQYMGLAALLLGDLDRAETHFRRVLKRDNRVPAAWYNLGVVYERKGLRDEAMRAYDRYLRLKGNETTDF